MMRRLMAICLTITSLWMHTGSAVEQAPQAPMHAPSSTEFVVVCRAPLPDQRKPVAQKFIISAAALNVAAVAAHYLGYPNLGDKLHIASLAGFFLASAAADLVDLRQLEDQEWKGLVA